MNKGKLKTDRGITLVTLIIAIVVMFIIAGTTVYSSLERFEVNKLRKMFNDIELLYDKVTNYYLKYNELPIKDEYTSELDFDKNVNDSGKYYIIDLVAMEGISLNYGKDGFNNPNASDDVYIINEVSHVIYYVKGIKVDGIMYYTTPEDKNSINDTIPPTKPEIKIISGDLNSDGKYTSDVEIEIIPGRDNWSGVNKTTYSINDGTETDITTLTNNILKITENGTYTIKLKTYDNNSQISQEEISFVIKKIPEKAYIVTLVRGSYFKEASYINKIKTISFVKGIDTTAVSNAIKTYELGNTTYGTEKDEVMGWIDSDYNLYIGSESTIYSKDLKEAFYNLNAVTDITFNNLNTSECISMSGMFERCNGLTTLDLSSFNTSKVTTMQGMFYSCSGLTTLDVSSFNTSKVMNMREMFCGCSGLTTLDLRNFDTSQVTNMQYMFRNCSGLTTLDLRNFDTSQVTTMQYMFSNCSGLTTLDVSSLNTSKVTNMGAMFSNCSGLTTLDVSSFNTSKVTNMNAMFSSCSGLTTLDVSSFNTSQVTNMREMFYLCSKLTTLDVSSFNTSQVTTMQSMFNRCSGLTRLDLRKFDTSQVTNMQYMFSNCSGLTTLDVSSFNTSKVTNMNAMFSSCSGLTTLDVSSFNTSQVTNMREMFYLCSKLTTLDVSSFNTSKVTNMSNMFNGCTKLASLNMSRATFENVTTYSSMFKSVPTNIIIVSNSIGQTFLRARLDETIGSGNGTINVSS